jgi:hypothetical protein
MTSRRLAGILLPWICSCILFMLVITDDTHKIVSGLDVLIPEPISIVTAIAFFLLGLPIQDPYLRVIASKIKPEFSLKTRLLNLEANAETLMKLESQIKQDEFKLPECSLEDRIRLKAKILTKLNQMSIALEHIYDDQKHMKKGFGDFKKFIDDTKRRISDESH